MALPIGGKAYDIAYLATFVNLWCLPNWDVFRQDAFYKWIGVFICSLATRGFKVVSRNYYLLELQDLKNFHFFEHGKELYSTKLIFQYGEKLYDLVSKKLTNATPGSVKFTLNSHGLDDDIGNFQFNIHNMGVHTAVETIYVRFIRMLEDSSDDDDDPEDMDVDVDSQVRSY